MESVRIEISKATLEQLVLNGHLKEYKLLRVIIKDGLFLNDELHKDILTKYLKQKKELELYEWSKRNK